MNKPRIDMVKVGRAIKILRKSHNITQLRLAEETGWHHNLIRRVETGKAKLINLNQLDNVARFFGLTLSEFIKSIEDNTYMLRKLRR